MTANLNTIDAAASAAMMIGSRHRNRDAGVILTLPSRTSFSPGPFVDAVIGDGLDRETACLELLVDDKDARK